MSILTLAETETDPDAPPPAPANHEPVAHIATHDAILHSMMTGAPILALCGHEFVVRLFNPDGLPVCPRCKRISEGSSPGSPGSDSDGICG